MVKRIVIINDRGEVQKKYLPMPSETRRFSEGLLQKLIFEEPSLARAIIAIKKNWRAFMWRRYR